jgi:hypothetical protein
MMELEAIERCEHGWDGSPFNHPPIPAQFDPPDSVCPGGRRIPVTVNLGAVADVMNEAIGLKGWATVNTVFVERIVAAALVDPDGKPLT